MIVKVISRFEAHINGIVFNHEKWFGFILSLIEAIEDKTNTEVPFAFVLDVKEAFEDYFGEDADFAKLNNLINNCFYLVTDDFKEISLPTNNIKDLDFIFDYSDKFDEINRKVKDWDNTYGKEPEQ